MLFLTNNKYKIDVYFINNFNIKILNKFSS